MADAAIACATSAFVMISTDKAVKPTNGMGATNRAAEAYCQSLDLSPDKRAVAKIRPDVEKAIAQAEQKLAGT